MLILPCTLRSLLVPKVSRFYLRLSRICGWEARDGKLHTSVLLEIGGCARTKAGFAWACVRALVSARREAPPVLQRQVHKRHVNAEVTSGGFVDVPVNKPIRLLIGFRNKGDSVFMVDGLEASLRYPMDWSYTIANLTSVRYSREVAAQEEATFDYGFMLSDAFSSRPFTLSINLHYRDATNRAFFNPVFNETITVIEVDEGLDSQTYVYRTIELDDRNSHCYCHLLL